jgi:hypothetical protein
VEVLRGLGERRLPGPCGRVRSVQLTSERRFREADAPDDGEAAAVVDPPVAVDTTDGPWAFQRSLVLEGRLDPLHAGCTAER